VIGATHPIGIRDRSSGPRRRSVSIAVVVASLTLLPMLAGVHAAGALLDPFSMSPTAGPPGTLVHLGGTGCSPGIAVAPAQDYVKVTSTALSLSTNIPVAANGSWNGALTIPANAPALPGLVVATCYTNGLPSLLATYAPRTFTVTSAAPPPVGGTTPTTAPFTPTTAPPVTVPASTSTTVSAITSPAPSTGGTRPGDGGAHSGPGTTAVRAVPGGTGGSQGGASGPDAGGTGGRAAKNGHTTSAIGTAQAKLADAASAAGLPEPSLTRAARSDGGNALWILWSVLLALVAAASALLWWWQRRPHGDAEAEADAATGAA
jgi:hypothetical protein